MRTLPAAVSPVLAGSGIAAFYDAFAALLALLCLGVALALQVGVNYANDYSDGVRGTDADRVGPMRLVGSGAASPATVKAAAFAGFAVAAMAGLAIVLLTQLWWLLAVGAAAIAAAWFYTGGRRPYGYHGWGEVFVFVFFGLVAVGGTVLVQLGYTTPATWAAAVAIGTLACAILVANNLRDLRGDEAVRQAHPCHPARRSRHPMVLRRADPGVRDVGGCSRIADHRLGAARSGDAGLPVRPGPGGARRRQWAGPGPGA